jgi:hypothetical protein
MSGLKRFLAPLALALSLTGIPQLVVARDLALEATVEARSVATVIDQFYPSQLISTPAGLIEDKEVWIAKVFGLLQDAPDYARESVLKAKTQNQFERALSMIEQSQSTEFSRKMLLAQPTSLASGDRAKTFNNNNLVYRAVKPCRIMDTRSASFASGVQGPIAGNSLKTIPGFLSSGNWGTYGGSAAGDCGLGSPPGSNIYAIAMVVTILNPNFSAFLGISSSNSLPTVLGSVALNFTAGQGLSSTYIADQLTQNSIFFAMPAGLSAHVIFDVVGYHYIGDATFTTPASALTCNNQTTNSTTTSVGANGILTVTFPGCPTGFTGTGLGCGINGDVPQILLNEFSDGFGYCQWRNITGAAVAIGVGVFRAERRCCQVPSLVAQ